MGLPTPKHKNLIYDVGLHKGEDTDFYLAKGFNVVAFEANADNVAFCRQRFAQALDEGRLTIVEGAIAEPSGVPEQKIKFYHNTDHSFWGSSNEAFAHRSEVWGTNHKVIEVAALDFGQCVAQYGVPYYLKADIVGSETICLRALEAFANKPDYLSLRSEKVAFHKLEEEFNLLERLGYNSFQAVQQCVENLQSTPDAKEGKPISYTLQKSGSGFFGKDLPNEWKTRAEVIKEYRRIFVLYWLFGDYSYLMQTDKGRLFTSRLERIARRPLPGWYDTHAKYAPQ